MRLTVQFDLHSHWCSVDEVGGVDGGREGRRGSSTEDCSESGASNWRCGLRSLGADVECKRAKDGCCREGDVFWKQDFRSRVTASTVVEGLPTDSKHPPDGSLQPIPSDCPVTDSSLEIQCMGMELG